MFDALSVSASGMTVYRSVLDAVSDNLANVNTVRPTTQPAFQTRTVVAEAVEDGGTGKGARVQSILMGDPNGRLVYDPSNPLADAKGLVRQPDVDMAEQMTTMIVAQRAYQANLASVERARDAYQAALEIGR